MTEPSLMQTDQVRLLTLDPGNVGALSASVTVAVGIGGSTANA
jgi:hypothetical protein